MPRFQRGGRGGEKFDREERFDGEKSFDGEERFGGEERLDGEMLVERVEEVKGGVLCT